MDGSAMLRGIFPILLTPFDESGEVDTESLRREVRFCLSAGVHGLVTPGMASEVFYLTEHERAELVEICLEECEGRVPVVAGIYGECLEKAMESARRFRRLDVAAVLLNLPHFCRASDEYLDRYCLEISAVLDTPIILQNYPPPYGEGLAAWRVRKLIERCSRIEYVKEENEPPGHYITTLLHECEDLTRLRGVFGGKTGRWMLNELARGACGNMPAAAWADLHVLIYENFLNGSMDEARALHGVLAQNILPYEMLGRGYAKEILRLRGIFQTRGTRAPGLDKLDAFDIQEAKELYGNLQHLLEARKKGA